LKPGAIILVVYSHNLSTGKPVGSWLPTPLRRWYAEKYQALSINHWPRRLSRFYPALLGSMARSLEQLNRDATDLPKKMSEITHYDEFTDGPVIKVFVRRLRDQPVVDAIKEALYSTVLYTGGGIVPSAILSLPNVRVLHTHPRHLPHVRGADGVLWSTLVRGRPGASCFFMAESIDTGPIIAAQDFPAPTFNLPKGMERPDDYVLYQALFSYYDPLLRAEMLVKPLQRFQDISEAPVTEQYQSSGVTYHFMHPKVRREALGRLLISG
jgi:hypothetical protein